MSLPAVAHGDISSKHKLPPEIAVPGWPDRQEHVYSTASWCRAPARAHRCWCVFVKSLRFRQEQKSWSLIQSCYILFYIYLLHQGIIIWRRGVSCPFPMPFISLLSPLILLFTGHRRAIPQLACFSFFLSCPWLILSPPWLQVPFSTSTYTVIPEVLLSSQHIILAHLTPVVPTSLRQ